MSLSNHNSKNKNLIKNYNSNSLSKNKDKKQLIKNKNRNNKSMAQLPIRPKLNLNGMSDYSLFKMKCLNKESNIKIKLVNKDFMLLLIDGNVKFYHNEELIEEHDSIIFIDTKKIKNKFAGFEKVCIFAARLRKRHSSLTILKDTKR